MLTAAQLTGNLFHSEVRDAPEVGIRWSDRSRSEGLFDAGEGLFDAGEGKATAMLSKEDQRRFDEITQHLRATDPEIVARLGDRPGSRRARLLAIVCLTLWALMPPLAVIGGWVAAATSGALLLAIGLFLMLRRRSTRLPRSWRR